MSRTIEVLAPAGSPESLIAAVRCGAAAIYLGAEDFNARRAAHNFTREQLREAVEYCHIRGVAVHLALNTIVNDAGLKQALQLAKFACEIGVDALIVQDVGLARLLHRAAPEMPLHASTQLSCHSPSGVDFLHKIGFSRVVLSREMTKEEMAACVNRGVEIEVFVHGALCMSVSGQCYFSAMLGSRSGNRGMCAQPCRLPFSVADNPHCATNEEAALSLKDQCLITFMQELRDMGVASVKIEGRMKRPEYVAATTAAYSRAAHGLPIDHTMLDTLKSVFSRSGFTDGYYTNRRGRTMFGIRRKEDVTAAKDVLQSLARSYDKETPLVDVSLCLQTDECASRLTAIDTDGHTVTVSARGSELAVNRPISVERVDEQLHKSGNTPYRVVDTTIAVPSNHTLPLSTINSLRREALDALSQERLYRPSIPFDMPNLEKSTAKAINNPPKKIVRLADAGQWSVSISADVVVFPLDTDGTILQHAVNYGTIAAEIPRGIFGTEDTVRKQLQYIRDLGVTAVVCNTVNAITVAQELGFAVIGGFGLNIYNCEAVRLYKEIGLQAVTLSMEMTLAQMREAASGLFPVGALVYGRQPLMLTRNCPQQVALGGCRQCHHQGLIDRTGAVFPVMCHNGFADVLNSVPLYWLDKLTELPSLDFHMYYFTTESVDEIIRLVNTSPQQLITPDHITRGLYRRGVL